jgi:hypothetical protein
MKDLISSPRKATRHIVEPDQQVVHSTSGGVVDTREGATDESYVGDDVIMNKDTPGEGDVVGSTRDDRHADIQLKQDDLDQENDTKCDTIGNGLSLPEIDQNVSICDQDDHTEMDLICVDM